MPSSLSRRKLCAGRSLRAICRSSDRRGPDRRGTDTRDFCVMEPRRFELRPEVSKSVTVRLEDYRETASPDEDYLDISISMEEGGTIGVSLSLAEAEELRDALSAMISFELP